MGFLWSWISTGKLTEEKPEKEYIAPYVAPDRPSPAIVRKFKQLLMAMESGDEIEVARIQESMRKSGIAPPTKLSVCRKIVHGA